jgi:hypothetical protein
MCRWSYQPETAVHTGSIPVVAFIASRLESSRSGMLVPAAIRSAGTWMPTGPPLSLDAHCLVARGAGAQRRIRGNLSATRKREGVLPRRGLRPERRELCCGVWIGCAARNSPYFCTCAPARRVWSGRLSYRIPDLASECGLTFGHHEPRAISGVVRGRLRSRKAAQAKD